ncbi:RIP metalloprotease RseP [Pseudorhodoplanes sinuspersici]|uniref:Zinc metalloprotease n=1 Tax=Pseudorhodoplanes sinuspersici TaxID=1235591 RepID=A0A1W6ZWF8_9HYPH|nr:RIP metalloprotease RseP [Pseudorhodoplanes sinuspersici]ARQ01643.1 RIP metalloprotease RseP [Pseudorhodoplanes sinuspersici]RKE73364.1 site-2 protease [Pseudorhodoplanes sinuspersici]
MGFLEHFSLWGGGFTGALLPFLFVLTIVVFFHELGHFLVARLCGVRVLTFSVGFGPEIVGFNDRHGTRWKISAIPLGGYVKFFGDEDAASTPDQSSISAMTPAEKRESFHHQPVGKRAAIVAAGPIANFILAILIFAAIFTFYGRPSTSARIDAIQPESAAAQAGFAAGDVVVAINGRPIETFAEMQRVVSTNAGQQLSVTIDRGGAQMDLKATPALREVKDNFGNVHRIGVLGITRSMGAADSQLETVSAPRALWMGVEETWFVIDRTLSYIGGIVVGRESADQLGGPIRIAQVSGQVATVGFIAIMNLAAILSVSIGLLNLFPVPLLDGGHLLFYAIEAIRGRPLSERAQEMGFRIGLALVVMLMIFATFNDIIHLTAS